MKKSEQIVMGYTLEAIQEAWNAGFYRVVASIATNNVDRLLKAVIRTRTGHTLCIFPSDDALVKAIHGGLVQSTPHLHSRVYSLAQPFQGVAGRQRAFNPKVLSAYAAPIDLVVVIGLERYSYIETLALVKRVGDPRVLWITSDSGLAHLSLLGSDAKIQAVVDEWICYHPIDVTP